MKLDYTENYFLENSIVKLQPLTLAHFDSLLEYAENEPEIWAYNAYGADSKNNLEKYIANALENRKTEKEYAFVVIDKSSGKIIGSTRFYSIFHNLKTIEIGYTWYGKKYQGTSINKNCKYLLLQFAFEKLLMERVAFAANTKNERSINAMKSIGCQVEGVLRNCSLDAQGNRIDVIRLSILKEEWITSVKKNILEKL
jgi:N-acetyltransferase